MIIREATLEDQVAVLELARAFLATSLIGQVSGGTPAALEQLFAVVRARGAVFLAEEGGDVFGMFAVVAVAHPFTGAEFAEEIAWFVRADHRAGSAGPRLLGAAEEWTRQHNLWCLKMGAPVDQPQVARFYERRGYQAVETAYIKRT